MANLRKIKGKYYAYFYDPARTPARKSYPLRVTRKDAAEELLKRKEREWAEGKFDPWYPLRPRISATTVVEAREAFLEAKAHLRPKTRTAYRTALDGLLSVLPAGLSIADIAAEHAEAYVSKSRRMKDETVREPTDATRRHRRRHLAVFFAWCHAEGLIEHDPLQGVELPKQGKRVTAFLSPADVERLLRAIDAHTEIQVKGGHARAGENVWMKDVVLVAVGTGLRRGELCAMRWGWVDLEHAMLTVRSSDSAGAFRTKSGGERAVPLAGDALDVLARLRAEAEERGRAGDDDAVFTMPNGRPLRPDYVGKRFRFFADEAKLPRAFRFHSLRHTTASWLTMRGVPLSVTQAILGHSSVQVTERYAHLAPDTMRKAMHEAFVKGKLDPWREKSGGTGGIARRRVRLARAQK